MIILICGEEGSGKTTLAKPFAELIGAVYVNKDSYDGDLRAYIDGIASTEKTVVVDKRCKLQSSIDQIDPDYVVWMDTVDKKIQTPSRVDYHVSKWFDDTHQQLMPVVQRYMEKKNK
tara:strand:+ start:140 stop:490 length:351 start_codon:yes stop_codon:yes gene_type:complete